MRGIPQWIRSQWRDRGLCEDCGEHHAETFWQSESGPWICWGCCTRRQHAAR